MIKLSKSIRILHNKKAKKFTQVVQESLSKGPLHEIPEFKKANEYKLSGKLEMSNQFYKKTLEIIKVNDPKDKSIQDKVFKEFANKNGSELF